jgi:anti-sigma B factor antagonist
MGLPIHQSFLDVQLRGTVTVVTFKVAELMDDELIDALGRALADHMVKQTHARLVLNFSAVNFMASDMLGMLLALLRKVNAAGGRLALCAFNPRFREMMRTIKLNRVFDIYDTEHQALQSLAC